MIYFDYILSHNKLIVKSATDYQKLTPYVYYQCSITMVATVALFKIMVHSVFMSKRESIGNTKNDVSKM